MIKQANKTGCELLGSLIGVWIGDKGMDITPEPEGPDKNPLHETIDFAVVGVIDNADKQDLEAVWYYQVARKQSDDRIFYDQTGHWMWDPSDYTVMYFLTITRAVSVLAIGRYDGSPDADGNIVLNVAASLESNDWKIIQSPFMCENARTIEFTHSLVVGGDTLKYVEVTALDIYGNIFPHSDQNELRRVT